MNNQEPEVSYEKIEEIVDGLTIDECRTILGSDYRDNNIFSMKSTIVDSVLAGVIDYSVIADHEKNNEVEPPKTKLPRIKKWTRRNRSIIVDEHLTIDIKYRGDSSNALPVDHQVMPLIAAAPDLLNAATAAVPILEAYVTYYGDERGRNILEWVKKAINKANPTY